MRLALRIAVLLALVPLNALSAAQSAPSWPDLGFSACPLIAFPSTLASAHGSTDKPEQADFRLALSRQADEGEGTKLLIAFADKYPDLITSSRHSVSH